MKQKIFAVVLAGGKGSRLEPLTRERAKPAVPFGGVYRIIDFTLSNCLNSEIRQILLLTQYKSMSLNRHIELGWSKFRCRELNEFIDVVPPQQRIGENWYQGTADAVYQNIYSIEKHAPQYVIILAGDHIYKMNYRKMFEFHLANRADLTVAALPVSVERARKQFGVIEVDQNDRIIGFEEKPDVPKPLPDNPRRCLGSMGIYIFSAAFLFEELCRDAVSVDSKHDFGADIIPRLIKSRRVFAWSFKDETRNQEAYWRDVGTLDAYFDANMDLIRPRPILDIYDENWPIYTFQPNDPPPKFVFNDSDQKKKGIATDSLVCSGTIVSGGQISRSVLGRNVRVQPFAEIDSSILFDQVSVGKGAKIRKTVLDKGVFVPAGIQIGFNSEEDKSRGIKISPQGVRVIPAGFRF